MWVVQVKPVQKLFFVKEEKLVKKTYRMVIVVNFQLMH
jgi:hypothetical protein